MKLKTCSVCGKRIKGPSWEDSKQATYCESCKDNKERRILENMIEFQKYICGGVAALHDLCDEKYSHEITVDYHPHFTVFRCIDKVAELLGEPIQVAENEKPASYTDEEWDHHGWKWVFWVWHDGVRFEQTGYADREEDVAIAKKWEEDHAEIH